jgi:hypothetical protein
MFLPHANTVVEVLDGSNWNGVAVTSNAGSTNTKGSYSTIGTTSQRYDGFTLNLAFPGGAVRAIFDVAIGASNTIIAQDIFVDMNSAGSTRGGFAMFIPVRVPSGVDIKVRWQVSGGLNQVARVTIVGCCYGLDGGLSFRRAIGLNSLTGTTRVTSATVQLNGASPSTTGWQQVIASLANDIGGVILCPSNEANSVGQVNNDLIRYDLGMGASGAEAQILGGHLVGTVTGGMVTSGIAFYPLAVMAGKRLAWRCRGPNAATGHQGLGVVGLER